MLLSEVWVSDSCSLPIMSHPKGAHSPLCAYIHTELKNTFAHFTEGLQSRWMKLFLFSSPEMRQRLSNRHRDPTMCWFDVASDWETELERTGATGWRVSSINHRFEMAAR